VPSNSAAFSSPFTSGDCTLVVRPAVTVEVRELGSGRAIADSAKGTARAGTYSASLRPFMTDASSGKLASLQAYGPAGTYRIELQRPGFQPWTREDIRVTADRCGNNTVALRADLVVAPSQ
jgi:hypothetical protein